MNTSSATGTNPLTTFRDAASALHSDVLQKTSGDPEQAAKAKKIIEEHEKANKRFESDVQAIAPNYP